MKIALVSTLLGQKGYGAEISSLLLAKIIGQKEDLFIITTKSGDKLPFKTYSFPLLHRLPNLILIVGHPLLNKYFYRKFINIFKKEKPSVIHLQDYSMLIPTIKAARKLKIPVVFTARSYQFMCNLSTCLEKNELNFNCSKRKYKKCLKRSIIESYPAYFRFLQPLINPWFYGQNKRIKRYFQKLDYIITVSNFVKEQIITSGFDRDRIQTIKVPTGNWLVKKTKNNHHLLFSAGGLKKSKGYHFLIKAFRLVVNKHPDAILRIAGDGSARDKLKNMVHRLNLEKNVIFLGKIKPKQMKKEYTSAYFVVSPSLWPEPLSRIIFETFASGKTIVATAVGGSPELVKHNQTGLLVQPNNVIQMAASIIKLIENKKLRDKLASNAYQLIKKECNEKDIYRKHLKIYKMFK